MCGEIHLSLTTCSPVASLRLRKALDDDAKEPRVIQTIPKRGYRLLVKIEPVKPPSPRPAYLIYLHRCAHSAGFMHKRTRDDAVDGQPHYSTSHREDQANYLHS